MNELPQRTLCCREHAGHVAGVAVGENVQGRRDALDQSTAVRKALRLGLQLRVLAGSCIQRFEFAKLKRQQVGPGLTIGVGTLQGVEPVEQGLPFRERALRLRAEVPQAAVVVE